MACAPVEQAVTTEWFGPLKPYLIEIWPETRLMSAAGMKKGLSRRGPRSFTVMAPSQRVSSPPMPEPTMTPVRSLAASSSGIQPASSTACWPAATP
jgi:hypothetical protein